MKNLIRSVAKAALPQGAKDAIFGLGFDLAPDRFREFAYRYAFAPDMERSLVDIAKRGLQPSHIVDIGAFHGDWTGVARRTWPGARITMIEGNEEKRARLEEAAARENASLEISLLGARDGEEVTFHVMESGSSVYEEDSPYDRRVETRTLRSLDALLADGPPADFLKLDTQGYELEILRGAEHTLKNVQAVLTEVSLLQINKGAPLLADVTAFMAERGFVAYEIAEIHRRPLDGAMNQVDILFITQNSSLLAETAHR